MSLQVESFYHQVSFTFSHVLWDDQTLHAAIIDPCLDFDIHTCSSHTHFIDQIINFVEKKDLRLQWILETHAHADHLTAAAYLKQQLGGQTGIGEGIINAQQTFKGVYGLPNLATDGSQFDQNFSDGEIFTLGQLSIKVMATPGHTDDSISYVVEDSVFIGDTLFSPDYGTARTDFPGGDARVLYQSIQKLLSLPANTKLFLCHDYPPQSRRPQPYFTVTQQINNLHIRDVIDEKSFATERETRDQSLAAPKLIIPSVQINIQAGEFPTPDKNGQTFLKFPLNKFGSKSQNKNKTG